MLRVKTKHSINRASQAFRQAAAALRSSKSALEACYRRLCSRLDKGKAVTPAAHKLARPFCALMTEGQEYVDQGLQCYEERHRQRVNHRLLHRAPSTEPGYVFGPNRLTRQDRLQFKYWEGVS